MSLMRFFLPSDRIQDEMVQRAYLSGIDRVPWRVRTSQVNGELCFERSVSDSGNLFVPWWVEGHGWTMLSTGTLIERPEPYYLPLELARGTVSQLRNQRADWETIGLVLSDDVLRKIDQATQEFGRATIAEHGKEESNAAAKQSLQTALDGANLLSACYVEQALAVRRRMNDKLSTFLGVQLGDAFLDDKTTRWCSQAFNAACVPLNWREIESTEESHHWEISDQQIQWACSQKMTLCGGPLLLLDHRAIPDWLLLYEEDFDSLCAFVSEFIEATVTRYRGRVHFWQCAGRMNTSDLLGLTEEEKVNLTARAIELTRQLDPDTPVVISLDQPWAEYLRHKTADFPPLQFADALLRADLGLSALMLEINLGYHPSGSFLRNPLELSRMLDHWSILGVPLLLSLVVPSSTSDDPLAIRKDERVTGEWSIERQQEWVAQQIPLMLAKSSVRGVFWNQLHDAEPHDFPHSGLFDLRRHPKPALHQLTSIRQALLR